MRPVRLNLPIGAAQATQPVPLDITQNPFSVTVTAAATASGGSTTGLTVQVTVDDVQASGFDPTTAKWFSAVDANVVNKTGDMIGSISAPVTACRLINAGADRAYTFTVVQATTNP